MGLSILVNFGHQLQNLFNHWNQAEMFEFLEVNSDYTHMPFGQKMVVDRDKTADVDFLLDGQKIEEVL